jgi:hypothetical protein
MRVCVCVRARAYVCVRACASLVLQSLNGRARQPAACSPRTFPSSRCLPLNNARGGVEDDSTRVGAT